MNDDGSSLASLLLDERVREVGDVGSNTGGGVLFILSVLAAGLRLLSNLLQTQLTEGDD